VSDRFAGSRRAPVAAAIYTIEVIVIISATQVTTLFWALFFFVLIAFTVNSTHSLLGPAAAMDIGGGKRRRLPRRDRLVSIFGAALATKGLGWVLDHKGWAGIFRI